MADEPAPLAELEVITDGNRILIRRSNEKILDPLSRQYVLCLPLAGLLDEIEQQVTAVPSGGIDQLSDNRYVEGVLQ